MSTEEADRNTRHDIFLSFHGSEVLYGTEDGVNYTLRELAEKLARRSLQHRWVNEKNRIGILSIFFDDKKLTESRDGLIQKNILDGLLQTRGGGVVAILASRGYFQSKWCLAELLISMELSNQANGVNICFVSVDGISVDEIDRNLEFARKFARKKGFQNKFQYLFVRDICQANVEEKLRQIADWILRRGDGIVAGATLDDCQKNFVEEFLIELEQGYLDNLTCWPHSRYMIDGICFLFYQEISGVDR